MAGLAGAHVAQEGMDAEWKEKKKEAAVTMKADEEEAKEAGKEVSHAETVAADVNQAASQTAKAVDSPTKAATTSMQKAVKKAADTKEQHPKATDEASARE